MPMSDHDPLAVDEYIESISPRLLKASPECQPRRENRDDVVNEYAERMMAGDVFPPVRARFDGSDYYLANGYHRRAAAIVAGLETMPVRVRPGGLLDAIEDSCAANADHGVRREWGDVRRAIDRMFAVDAERGIRRSNAEIARHCGVSPPTVTKQRKLWLKPFNDTPLVTNRNGTTYLMYPAGGRPPVTATIDSPRPSIAEVVADMDRELKADFAANGHREAVAAVAGKTLMDANRHVARQRSEIGDLLHEYGAGSVRDALLEDRNLQSAWSDLIELCRGFADYLEGSGA